MNKLPFLKILVLLHCFLFYFSIVYASIGVFLLAFTQVLFLHWLMHFSSLHRFHLANLLT